MLMTFSLQEMALWKDLGSLSTFLGIQASSMPTELLLHQQTCARGILKCVEMENCHLILTPTIVKSSTLSDDLQLYHDAKIYRQIVGALQYLTIIRPDLSYTINKLCQHMHLPLNSHFHSLKRVLRYIQDTTNYGIIISPTHLQVMAYCDTNWAGDTLDRRSTTGYCIFLGTVPILWAAKKLTSVARSSTEAEYRALASTIAEILWI